MERAELLAALTAYPAVLADAAQAAATRSTQVGEWPPDVVVRHLIAVETDVHQSRLSDLAATHDPHWSWVEPPPWEGEPMLGLDAVLDRFASLRRATLATVAALDDAGWRRTGTHTRLGVWDVEGLLRNAVDHDREHLAGLR